jgi:hypothetical protein
MTELMSLMLEYESCMNYYKKARAEGDGQTMLTWCMKSNAVLKQINALKP